MRDAVCIFPDTNVFLHFPPLKDIDWCSLSKAKQVRLIVCLTVIHELDSKKGDPRLSERAERAIREIREARRSDTVIRPNVSLVIFNRELRASEFPDTLSPDIADDRILHLAKLFQMENAESIVAIATGDYGMELRAEASGVELIPLDSSLRLPHPQDEQSKKLKQTLQELNTLKNRLPELTLGLSIPDGPMTLPHEITFALAGVYQPVDIDEEMQRMQSKYPKHGDTYPRPKPSIVGFDPFLLSSRISKEDWQDYDENLTEFYEKYRKHLELITIQGVVLSRSIFFDLWLKNDGNGVATDIDVKVDFPSSVKFVGRRDRDECEILEKKYTPPTPPEKPEPVVMMADLSPSFDTRFAVPQTIPRMPFLGRIDEWTPSASVQNLESAPCEIHVRLGKLKHANSIRLGKFMAELGNTETIAPFHANFTISTTDLSKTLVGKMPFIVQSQGET